MIAYCLVALFTAAGLIACTSLLDSAIRARHSFVSLKRERALAMAGFVPQVAVSELRLRSSHDLHRGAATRPFAKHVPQGFNQPLGSAAA